MNASMYRCVTACCVWLLLCVAGFGQQGNGNDASVKQHQVTGGNVLVVQLHYAFSATQMDTTIEAIQAAHADKVHAIILDIGPSFRVVTQMQRLMQAVRWAGRAVPVYAFVGERARGAGTLLCLTADAVFMAPGSFIGPADAGWWIDELDDDNGQGVKEGRLDLAEARVRVRGLAEETGQIPEVAMALVDPQQVVKIGDHVVSSEGQLLSLTANEATRYYEELGRTIFARAVVNDVPALLELVGISQTTILMPGAGGLVEATVKDVDGQRQPTITADAWAFEKLGVTGGEVHVIPLKGEVDQSLIIMLRRAFREAKQVEELRAIIVHMDTPGGRVDLTKEIIDMMREARQRSPVYVFVDGWGASAGAIICLASDAVFMSAGSNLGAAMPITVSPGGGVENQNDDFQEKMLSHLRGYARALAEENGYHPDVAEAFIDRSKRVLIGGRVVSERGELLTLTATEATRFYPAMGRPLFATAIVANAEALTEYVGITDTRIRHVEVKGVEKLARWITMLAPLLIIGFLLGFYTEINTPGFGVPGTIALVCLGVMLFGHYVAGLAGYEEMALIGLGVILLVVELFVIPGFGFVGFIGIGCILTGIVMSMIPRLPDLSDLPSDIPRISSLEPFVQGALVNMAITLVASIFGFWLLAKYLPRTSSFGKLVLLTTQRVDEGYIGLDVEASRSLIGASGVALTDMRPSGLARIEGQRLDVVSSGDYILKGDRVRVTRVNGPRVEVVLVKDADASGEGIATS